jgi:hypothetical protein
MAHFLCADGERQVDNDVTTNDELLTAVHSLSSPTRPCAGPVRTNCPAALQQPLPNGFPLLHE